MDGTDPTNFMTELLLEVFGLDYFQHRPILEREYQLGRSSAAGGTDSNKSRPFIMLFHLFQDKERILRRSRDGIEFRKKLTGCLEVCQPVMKDRKKLPYTDAVIHETNVAPMGLPHSTTCDVHFQGFIIKKVSL
ncbi:hypothetical protein MHYP_G00148620 [Metynnis hypsauchen]